MANRAQESLPTPPGPAGGARGLPRLGMILLAIAGLGLVLRFAIYLDYAWTAIFYRYELFDAEGIVWQQAMLIPGPRMYGDIDRFPFLVFHYPPLYHLLVRGAAELGQDGLAAGRAISVLATLVTGLAIAVLAYRTTREEARRGAALAGGALGGLAFFCFYHLVIVSPMLRVDMLAVALGFLGVLLAGSRMARPGAVYGGMALFVLSAFTKQTSISAPAACLAVLLLVNPKLACKAFGFGLALGCAGLAVMTWATDGGFLRHLVMYNLNRVSLSMVLPLGSTLLPHMILLLLAALGVVVTWQRRGLGRVRGNLAGLRHDVAASMATRLSAILVVYLALSTVTLGAIAKSGAGLNYFIEWMAVLSVFIGTLGARTVEAMRSGRAEGWVRPMTLLMGPLLIAQMLLLPTTRAFEFTDPAEIAALRRLEDRVRAAGRPVLADDMVLLMRAGKGVPMEPAIFLELTTMGRWDERGIVRMIDAGDFAFVVTRSFRLFTPAVAAAIRHAYPRTEQIAGRTVHLPAGN